MKYQHGAVFCCNF